MMVFLARIDGKYFCGLCGSSLHDVMKKCPVCQSGLEETQDCIFCEQCGSITPSKAEMCEVCGAKRKITEQRSEPHPLEPPPIPTIPQLKPAQVPSKIEEEPFEPREKEPPVLFTQKELQPPAAPNHASSSVNFREMLLRSKKSPAPQPAPPVANSMPMVSGTVSEKETNPAVLHAQIKELQAEIEMLRMSLDDPDIKVTKPAASQPQWPKFDQAVIDKLVHVSKTLTVLLEKMKKYEGSAIYKILVNLQEDTREILKLLKTDG